jgi:hypothetical protein
LSNVNLLVEPTTRQRFVVDANDDVTERDGSEAAAPWERQEAFCDAPACNFERTFDPARSGADRERNERKDQAD